MCNKDPCWSFKLIVTWMFDVSPDSVDTGMLVSHDLNFEWRMKANTSMSFTLLYPFLSLLGFRLPSYRRYKREASQFSPVSIDSTSRWVTSIYMSKLWSKRTQNCFRNSELYICIYVVSNFWNSHSRSPCNVIFR